MSSVAQFAGQSQAAASENAARAANRVSAINDYNKQEADDQYDYVQETKKTNQEGFDNVLAARAAEGKAHAEAASLGAGGVSVAAVMNELVGQEGRAMNRVTDAHNADLADFKNKQDSAFSQASTRINANQPVSGPSPLGLMINMASAIA